VQLDGSLTDRKKVKDNWTKLKRISGFFNVSAGIVEMEGKNSVERKRD